MAFLAHFCDRPPCGKSNTPKVYDGFKFATEMVVEYRRECLRKSILIFTKTRKKEKKERMGIRDELLCGRTRLGMI